MTCATSQAHLHVAQSLAKVCAHIVVGYNVN